jgi:ketosteroid isomerase-like protein
MRRISRFAVSLAALILFSCSQLALNSSTAPSEETAVLKAEHEWVDAALKGDVNAFSSLMSDEYLALLTGARIRDKAAWVAGLQAGTTTYRSVDLSNLKVRLYGNTAVVFGDYSQVATSGGKDNSASGKYLDVWVKRGGHWQVVASSFSRTPSS